MSAVAMSITAAETPRSTVEIKRQLAELWKVKQAAEAFGTPDFSSRAGWESLTNHEADLKDELRAAEMLESGSDAELVLDGDPVRDHAIQANFFGVVMAKVQQLVNAIAQVISNAPTSRAPVPRNIIAENRLMVTGWFPSSFAIRLRLPTKEELQQVFEPTSREVMDSLTEILGQQVPSEKIVELVSHARVKKHYSELLDEVAKQNASICLRTRRRPFGVRLDSKQARERVDWMDLLQTKEDQLTLVGVLTGGSIEAMRFELKVDDEIYRGKTSDAARKQMESIKFGARVEASIKAITTVHEEGVMEPATSYVMTALKAQ